MRGKGSGEIRNEGCKGGWGGYFVVGEVVGGGMSARHMRATKILEEEAVECGGGRWEKWVLGRRFGWLAVRSPGRKYA